MVLPSGCVFSLTAADNTSDGGTGLPVITTAVTLQGNGATITRATASATPAFRLLDVASSGNLTVAGLTLNNGLAVTGIGGGAINSHGTLSVEGSTFTSNSSPSTQGPSGGAIDSSGTLMVTQDSFSGNVAQEGGGVFNQGTATVAQSTFTDNTATIYGGGALLNAAGSMTVTGDTFVGNSGPGGGAIDNDTILNIINSTFENNTAGTNGGGAMDNFGTTTISQSTMSGNGAPYGANLLNYGTYTLKVSSSIVANGATASNCSSAPIIDGGYNIDTGTSCGFTTANNSLNNTQPNLDALASNGGPTETAALPAGSPGIDLIPPGANSCGGSTDSTDQRGVARPQGSGCDVGAYEFIVTTGDTIAPTVPSGLAVTATTFDSASLQWNQSTDDIGVTGYTVYRNGVTLGTTGGAPATSFTDVTARPATTYSYTVDAFDGSGNHSAASSPISVTTPAPTQVQAAQSDTATSASPVTSISIPLSATVHAGDLLVGWFGQYDSTGQVTVSDPVNGAWTRVASSATTFSSGSGDIALFYVQNSAPSPYGVTVTVSAPAATYLQGSAADYTGVATTGALDQVAVSRGNSTAVDSGPTAAVGAGELVVGGILTGGSPGTVTPGSTQGQAFTVRTQSASGSSDLEDVTSSTAGTQNARATFGAATDWYATAGVFHPFGSGTTQPPTVPTGLAATSVTASSVSLAWNASTDTAGVAGYTVYRNGSKVGTTTGATATTYTDSTVAASTTYSYTVDAFDASGNHSAQSSPISVTTPAPSVTSTTAAWVQGGSNSTGGRVTSMAIPLSSPVHAGDLLVGWFGQYDSTGQVTVSDPLNGAWTRVAATTMTFSSGTGDIALFYVQNSAASSTGVTVMVASSAGTYLQGSASEYSGVPAAGALDQVAVAQGVGTAVDSGPTAAVAAGELVIGGILTGGGPGTVTPGSTLGLPFTIRTQNGSGSADLEDVLSGAAGAQDGTASFSTSTDWYAVAAVFKP